MPQLPFHADERNSAEVAAMSRRAMLHRSAVGFGSLALASLLADQQAKNWDKNPPDLQQITAMRAQIAELRKSKITAPLAVSIAEGGVPGSNREKIGDAPVYLRGEYQRPGPIAPRRFPVILAGEKQAPLGTRTSQSGRRELAEWIVSADNPLTARVMVNRIWQQMIGRGLVRSPDNFGRLGERPTHPELLDHLSVRFIRSGWSVKSLVRDIALSATFRQATFAAPEATRARLALALVADQGRPRVRQDAQRRRVGSREGEAHAGIDRRHHRADA